MKNRNGLYGFELLIGLDDDMIAAAILPDEGGAAVVAKPSRRERLGDFMSNGWVAVILSVVVSLAVLAAIITAGFQAPPVDPVGTDGHETTTPTPETTDLSETTAPPEDNRPELYGLWDGESIRVIQWSELTPVGFVTSRIEYASNGTYFVSEPEKTVLELAEEMQVELPRAVISAGTSLHITSIPANCTLEATEIYTPDMTVCYEQASATSLKIDLPAGEYLVAVRARYRYEDATGDQVDFLFRLTVRSTEDAYSSILLKTGRREYPIMGYIRSETYAGSWDGDQTYTGIDLQKRFSEASYYAWDQYMEVVYLAVGQEYQLFGFSEEDRILSLDVYQYDSVESMGTPIQVLHVTEQIETVDLSTLPRSFYHYWAVLTVEKSTEDSTWVVEYPFLLRLRREVPVSSPSESVTLEINGQTVIPNECFNSSMSLEEDGRLLCVDGWYFSDIYENDLDILPEIHAPVGTSAAIHISRENGYLSGVSVYDFRGNRVAFGEDLSVLSTLPAGSYCLDLSVRYRGEYVPEYDTETGSSYTCAFILTLE